jgi:hypothetical protein
MRTLQASFVVVALFGLTCGLKTPASGATLTCVQEQEITEEEWVDPFVMRLRDQGLQRPVHPMCATAMVSDVIKPGDADMIEALVQRNLPFLARLALNSNGGDMTESMQIGRIARRYYLETEAPTYGDGLRPHWIFSGKITDAPGARCASACFFAWLGGVNRTGDALGIHRPFPPASEMQKLSPAEADRLYRSLSDKILGYLSEMGAAPHWLGDMMRIPSDEIRVVPAEQISGELEGDARAFFDLPFFAQWKASLCGTLTTGLFKDWRALYGQKLHGGLPERTSGYYDYLNRQVQENLVCGNQAVIMARWQLRTGPDGSKRVP